MRSPPAPAALLLAFILSTIAACSATTNHSRIAGFETGIIKGEPFLHRVLFKPGAGELLHVYLEGDGRPWVTPISVAIDPTPRHPLLPALLASDPAPALYLGRPCYFGTADPACEDARWWTSHRYAGEVVTSLAAVLDRYSTAYQGINLIGYSGGGTLAYLLAAERDDVHSLLTLAANLNVRLWCQQHGYTPLSGSRDPAREPPLSPGVAQWHFRGEGDSNVSHRVISSVLQGQDNARLLTLPDIDHRCCWAQHWPELLEKID